MVEKALKDFLTIWVTVEPIGTLALFASLASGMTEAERRRIALKAVTYSTVILLGSMVAAQAILTAMNIQLLSLQVAGGLILLVFSLQMIFGYTQDASKPEAGHDVAVFPLAVPSIAGAEAIMAVVLLTDSKTYSIGTQFVTAGMVVAVMAITFVLLLLAGPILRVIGRNGAAILERLMGMILAALAVELIMEAVGAKRWLAA